MSGDPGEQHVPSPNAWVRCDDCYKWRRIPAALADSIEDTNSNWYTIVLSFIHHIDDSLALELF